MASAALFDPQESPSKVARLAFSLPVQKFELLFSPCFQILLTKGRADLLIENHER